MGEVLLRDCKTAREVFETYRMAHDRLWGAKPPPPTPVYVAPPVVAAKPLLPMKPRGGALLFVRDIPEIQQIAAEYYRVPVTAVLSPRREHPIKWARFVGISLARELTKASLNEIGAVFRRDHTTVLHAIRRCQQVDPKEAAEIAVVREQVLQCLKQGEDE